ncbi:hypothetical protein [Kribbella sp. VKM Ac-2568]|uniref:hypothetical protein n=1 Tax=Kribbella sp. VKM Ac-2568 TaxID=2512219 RepID=UPI00104D6C44|nr:hypothetical protein [Kribbella sp. VKM Ac-2568]TCM48953.1 hypothetical protein EV648_103221 [Kribbella sp. VKM Ac-2568]
MDLSGISEREYWADVAKRPGMLMGRVTLTDAISKARIKRVSDDARSWSEPSRRHSVEVIARIYTASRDINGYVRFVDVEGCGWVANSQTAVESDDELEQWIEDGFEFAQRDLDPHQRSTLTQTDDRAMPDFNGWAAEIDSRDD